MAVTVIKNYTRRVVAPKKSKTGLILGIALLVGGGIGVLAWYLHNKKKNELAQGSTEQSSESTSETSKDAVSQIDVTAKSGTPIIVKDDKTKKPSPKSKPTTQQVKAPTFPTNTVLSPKAPLMRAMAYDRLFKEIGNISSAKFKKDISERWMEAEATLAKGLSFETKNVYLLKTDWIKA